MQSGGQGAGIQLQVGLDLTYFRNQLPRLGTTAAGYQLPLNIKFDRKRIADEYRLLNRYISGKTFDVKIESQTLEALSTKVKNFQERLKELQDVKIDVAVGAVQSLSQEDARKIKSGLRSTILGESKKILIPTTIIPSITQKDVSAFKSVVKEKLSGISVKVKADVMGGFAGSSQGVAGLMEYMQSQGLLGKTASGMKMQMGGGNLEDSLNNLQQKAKKLAADLTAMGNAARTTGQASIQEAGKVLRPQNYGLKIASLLSSVEKLDSDLRKASVETGVDLLSALDDLSSVLRLASNSFVKITGLSDTLDDTLMHFDRAARQAGRATAAYAERIRGRAGIEFGASAGRMLPPSPILSLREIGDIMAQGYQAPSRGIKGLLPAGGQSPGEAITEAYIAELRRSFSSRNAIAGLLPPASVGRAASLYATGAVGGETQAELFARREREARMRSAQRETRILSERGGVLPGTTFMGDDFVRGGGRDRVTGSGQPPQRGGALALFSGTTGPSSPLPKDYLEIGRAIKSLDPILQKSKLPLTGAISELSGEFGTAVKQVLLFGTAYKALAFLTGIPAQALQASASLQSFNNQLLAITGTASEAARSTQFINATVSQFNIPLESARQGFVRLYASMAPAGMGPDTIENLFTGISQASATLGLSADQVDRVTYAFSQMASKGKVMSEEVTGQLGDVIPGALSLMANAAGLSMAEFKKAMEDGLISGAAMEQLFTNLPIVLEQRFGKGAAGAAKTLQGQLNNLSTATKTFYESFNPIVNSVAKVVLPLLSSGLKDAQSAIAALGLSVQGINPATNLLSKNAKAIYGNLTILKGTVTSLGSAIQSLGGIFNAFGTTLSLTLQLFNAIVGNPIGQFLLKLSIYASLSAAAINLLTKQALVDAIAKFGMMIRGIDLSIKSLKSFIATTRAAKIAVGGIVAGGILVGLEMLVSHIAKATEQTEKLRKTAILAAEALKQMSYSQMIQEERDIKKRIQNLEKLQNAAQSGSLLVKSPTKAQEEIAVTEGLPITGRAGQRGIDITRAEGARQQLLQSLRDVQTELETRDRSAVSSAVITPIDLSAGEDGKAEKEQERLAKEQQQNAIDAANRQNALNKAIFDASIALSDQEYRHAIDLIDARNQYELSGLDSIAARQEKFQQDLQKIELQRIDTVRKAEQEAAKASVEYRAAQNTAVAAGGGGAIFGDTGRTFNAAGWVHGHFQNMNREALVKDTVQVVMGLLQQGSAAELSSGAQFKQGMSESQIEGLVRQGIASHKRYASGASAIDVFVPKGTAVPTGLSGVGDLGGNAGVTGTLPMGSQLMHLDPKSVSGVMQRREAKAGGKLDVETQQFSSQQEQTKQAVIFATNRALEERAALIKANINTIFPVAEQRLENDLMKIRNQLQLQGMPQEYIDYQEDVAKKAYEASEFIKKQKEETDKHTQSRDALLKKQKEGVALTPKETQALKYHTEAIEQNNKSLEELTEQQRQYKIAALESAIASMKNADALKAMQETMDLIKGSVESASNSYKGFMKEVITGGDPAEALKKFQEAITDQVLTIFLDFAMKPVEDFFKEQLSALFGVQTEEQAREEAIAKMEEQLKELQESKKLQANIDKNVQALAQGSSVPGAQEEAQSTSFASAGGPLGGFDAGSVFGEGVNLTGGIFDTIAQQMGGAMESFDSFSAHMGQFVDSSIASAESLGSWNQSMATSLSESLTKQTDEANKQSGEWQKSLGTAVSAIGIAAGAVMGIAAGISQIKKGGTSNVLGGIGSIFMSLGGAIGGLGNLGLFGADGGVAPKGWKPFPVTAFANGGMVNGPTLGLVGEGKYNEAIVPLPNGRSIPVDLGDSLREKMGNASPSSSSSPVLSMSFETTSINGVEYVSRDQLEQAMMETRKLASKEGAMRGANLAIDRLQQSPNIRRRVGMR